MAIEDELARFAVDTSYGDIPDETIEYTKHLTLKTTVGMMAGSKTPSGRKIARYLSGARFLDEAGVFGCGFRTSAEDAALGNGFFAHAAELEDDQFPVATSDITVVPVIYPLTEKLCLSGEEFVEATAIAIEIMNRVGVPVTPLGFTSLPFFGVIGAQIASAKAHKFDVERTKNMLGLGISQSSGFRINFGTDAHYWESAMPCRNAVATAKLVRYGATSSPDIESWLTELLGQDIDLDHITRDLGEEWYIHKTWVKKYPVCFLTHRQIDALRELMEEHEITHKDVDLIETDVGPVDATCDRPEPKDPDDARFSFQHVLATILLKGDVSYQDLTPERINDPKYKELRSKVRVHIHDDWPAEFNSGTTNVTLTLKDGEELRREREQVIGGPEEPLTTDEIKELYRKLCQNYYPKEILSEENIEWTTDVILNMEDYMDLRRLTDTLTFEVL